MSSDDVPQRRNLLALHQGRFANSTELSVSPNADSLADAPRQMALSVPDSVRALGEPLTPFFEACGGRHAIALCIRRNDGTPPETCVFQQPFVLIGRSPDSDLALADDGVSFRHYYLQLIDGRWLFIDMPGVSGPLVERGRGTSGWFDADRELTVGGYTITRLSDQSLLAAEGSEQASPPTGEGVRSFEIELVNANSGSHGRRIPSISTPVTLIGSSRQCDVWLKDESVSKVHASLVLTPQGLWVVDLLGRTGVQVDGRRVFWKLVHDGSVVQIGRFQLRVWLSASRDGAPKDDSKWKPTGRKRRSRESEPASGGGLSEKAVLKMFQQMADTQSQFFQHSQYQTELIKTLLAQLGRTQQSTVRQDLDRIEQISGELQEIKQHLAELPDAVEPDRGSLSKKHPARQLMLGAADNNAKNDQQTPVPSETCAVDFSHPDHSERREGPSTPIAFDSSVASDPTKVPLPDLRETPAAGPQPPPATADIHALLSQRMANLAQEQTSLWQQVLKVFGRKRDDPAGD